jgi:hypothetical protein
MAARRRHRFVSYEIERRNDTWGWSLDQATHSIRAAKRRAKVLRLRGDLVRVMRVIEIATVEKIDA